ncbi:envelope glycoprotein B [Elephant endotheliotropic herpesvirus 6]|nr:U39 [Elephant endotheliotropic herpesvirus 6]UEH20610.1 envelope glycoprotein B [Elephant endotheliotropic herpesvirus 6]
MSFMDPIYTQSCMRTCMTRDCHICRFTFLLLTLLLNDVFCQNENKVIEIKKDEEIWPYRICSGMSQATDIVRFGRNIQCPEYSPKDEGTEGILLIYKPNIVPYIFPVRIYYKELTIRYRYADVFSYYDMGDVTKKIPIMEAEKRSIDVFGHCYSAARYVEQGAYIDAYDGDEANHSMSFMLGYQNPDGGVTRYVTVDSHRPCLPGTWLRKTCTTVNCIVTDTYAKSRYPYDFFAISTGEIVDGSPFFNGQNNKKFSEPSTKFKVYKDYQRLQELTISSTKKQTFNQIAFLEKRDYSIAWEVKDEQQAPCQYILWKASTQALMTKTVNNTYHFTSKELTATFGANDKEELKLAEKHPCVYNDAKETLEKMFNQNLKDTHIADSDNGKENYSYISQGGLILIFKPVKNKEIVQLMNITHLLNNTHANITKQRRKRDVSNTNPNAKGIYDLYGDLNVAQVQFAFNTLRAYINHALMSIADAWCRDQKRTNEIWGIISKINPSAALSAIFDKPVSARYLGDVISVSKCINVDQESVRIYQSLKVPKTGEEWGDRLQCYSRPLVTFRLDNETASTVRTGQLGTDNEILLGNHRTELCQENSIRYFIAGTQIHVFQDHEFYHTIKLGDVDIVDTFVHLNISFLHNIDFQMLRLYTQEEQYASRLLDLETLLRDFNTYRQRIYKLEQAIITRPYVPPAGMQQALQGLTGVGSVITGTLGAMQSLVSGVASFLQNPFGGTLSIILIGCIIVGVIIIYNRMNQSRGSPIDYYFPYVNQTLPQRQMQQHVGDPPSYEESTGSSSTYSKEDALSMLKAMQALDKSEKEAQVEAARSEPSIIDRIRRRGYTALRSMNI